MGRLEQKYAVSTALLSYVLVKRAGTAVNRSSSCLYTVLASGCAVLQYGRLVKTPNKSTDEQQVYVDIHSVYGFCSRNLCIFNVMTMYFYCYDYVFLFLWRCIFIVMTMYFYCYDYVFLLLWLCIFIVMTMNSHCYDYVFSLLWLCILIVYLCMTTLTEVFPYFLFNCKANARVKPAKTGHSPHSS